MHTPKKTTLRPSPAIFDGPGFPRLCSLLPLSSSVVTDNLPYRVDFFLQEMTSFKDISVSNFLGFSAVLPAMVATPMVAAGCSHTVAIKSDGTLLAWGSHGNGQLGEVLHTC